MAVNTNSGKSMSSPVEFAGLARQRRQRDFSMLSFVVGILLLILIFSGTLNFIVGVSTFVLFLSAAFALYVTTSSYQGQDEIVTAFAAKRRSSLLSDMHPTEGASTNSFGDIQSIIEGYPQPTLLSSFDGRVYVSNGKGREIFRLPPSQALAPAIIRRPELLQELKKAETQEPLSQLEIEVSGTPDRYFKTWIQPMMISSERYALIVLRDLTDLRRAEKARADFLANASHELRTPLTSLAGFIETLRGPAKDDPESWDRFLEIMYGQTERMKRLIHDLLSLSRIELSEHNRPNDIVEFKTVLEEVFQSMLPIANERQLSLELLESSKAVEVYGRRDELIQVMQNLIENALKYTRPNTHVTVEVEEGLSLDEARAFTSRQWEDASRITVLQHAHPATQQYIGFRVSDQGDGISREHLPRLGERFYRVDEGRDRAVGGTGLGLAIVKHIMSRHRGGFAIESETERGSAFGFWLPMNASPKKDN